MLLLGQKQKQGIGLARNGNSMILGGLEALLGRFIIKKGGIHVLLWVGDLWVKSTKTTDDDKAWEEIKKFIEKFK